MQAIAVVEDKCGPVPGSSPPRKKGLTDEDEDIELDPQQRAMVQAMKKEFNKVAEAQEKKIDTLSAKLIVCAQATDKGFKDIKQDMINEKAELKKWKESERIRF